MKQLFGIKRMKIFWMVFGLCFLFVVLRFPSLFEPNWYGDEGIYQSIGFGLRSGRQFYTGVWDNKPPLLFVIYALAYGDQYLARLFSLIFGLGAVIAFYSLSKKIFVKNSLSQATSLFFVLFFGLPIIEGNIANSENFMLLPILVSANLLYPVLIHFSDPFVKKQKLYLFLAGIILSLSFLIKIVSVFDFAAFLTISFILFFYTKHISHQSVIKNTLVYIQKIIWFIVGFLSPVGISIIYFNTIGVLTYYMDAAFGRNVDYVGWANYFIIPQGLLYIRILLLSVFLVALFYKRKSFSKETLFILIWLAFSMFNSYFSYRPYTHYLLLLLPSASLFVGLLVKSSDLSYKIKVFFIGFVIFLTAFSHFHYWSLQKTVSYYINYFHLVSGRIDFRTYQSFFDSRNPKDYVVASYIKSHTSPGDVIFLWGNSAQIYPLSKTLPPGRYSAAYHIGTNKKNVLETEVAIKNTRPKYIIITPDVEHFPFDLSEYTYTLTIEDAQIYERTF